LGVARAAGDLLKAVAIELAGRTLEARIVSDLAHDLSVGDIEAKLPRALVEGGFRHHLPGELLVETQQLCLIRRDRAAEFAAQLLYAVVVDLAELLDGDLHRTDLGDGRAAEAAE